MSKKIKQFQRRNWIPLIHYQERIECFVRPFVCLFVSLFVCFIFLTKYGNKTFFIRRSALHK